MADFNIRSESVDVEQIMRQIRARIQEKRGVDYTEEQVRELASVRLEKFLDPKNLRSDLLEQFRRSRPTLPEPPAVEPPYVFDDTTLFASHRGALRLVRKLLKPLLKLFFNPNTLNQVLHAQAQFNVDVLKRDQRRKIEFDRSRGEWNALYYEVLHNLVLETTRNGIELKNLKMRVEALASRLDFSERRVRALEGVVQYRPEAVRHRSPGAGRHDAVDGRDRPRLARTEGSAEPSSEPGLSINGEQTPAPALGAQVTPSEGRRRRRRRRGRRPFGVAADTAFNGEQTQTADDASPSDEGATGVDDAAADTADEPDSQ
jgi:hypothetical protein